MGAVVVLSVARPMLAQNDGVSTIPVPAQIQTNRDALVALTRDSGNAGFGQLVSQLIALEVATAPMLSTASGFAFLFDEAAEAQTPRARTFGPMLLERALTSGHLATTVGLTTTTTSYDTVSGLALESLPLARFSGATPVVSTSTLDLGVETVTSMAFARLGLGERVDVGVALPIVSVSVDGVLVQEERATGTAILPVSRSSVGLGDMALFGKIRAWKSVDDRHAVAALVTVRVPTGDAEDLRGLDAWRTLVSGTGTLGLGPVSVHVAGGYEFWNEAIGLSTVLPSGQIETWDIADQAHVGVGVELEAHRALSVSVDVVRRELFGGGRLETRAVATPVPVLGIESTELLAAGPEQLHSLTLAVGARWSPAEYVFLSFGALMSPSSTALKATVTPVLGFGWTFCREC